MSGNLYKYNDGKTCYTTKNGDFETHYKKEFQWTKINQDTMNSLITKTGMAASENDHKRVLVYLGAARRILAIETSPSIGDVKSASVCTVKKCKFTNNQLTNSNVEDEKDFSTANLGDLTVSQPPHASGFRFECDSAITEIKITFVDVDTELPVYPRMSIPVTNAVKVWDSYCKTAVNKGTASRAYLVGNESPENANNLKHHLNLHRDYMGIRSDEIGGFHRYCFANDPAYIAVFFGFRIRVCNFFVSMPEKAPKNLVLFMDGEEIAKVNSKELDKVTDLLDWYNVANKDPNDLVGSAFKLVWPIYQPDGVTWTVAHLTRITISYTEPGHPIRHWKSTLGTVRNANDEVTHKAKYLGDYGWNLHQTEHPKVRDLRLTLEKENQNEWEHLKAQAYSRRTLCRPGIRWYPRDGAVDGYGPESSWKGDDNLKSAQRAGALMFVCQKEINLTAFIINFPDFSENIDENDGLSIDGVWVNEYLQRARNSGMKLIAQMGNFETEKMIAEFDKGQIAANRLNLLDYRTTNYLSQIKTLKLILERTHNRDIRENVINSIDIFYYINEFTPQKVWESTHRLKNSPVVALPSYIGVKDDAMLTIENDSSRVVGHTKQMITEGFPHYWKAGSDFSTNRRIDFEFNGEIVMTSFIFETCRIYRENNYRNIKLEVLVDNTYNVICETPTTVGERAKKLNKNEWTTLTVEDWAPGDHIEMFDHKKVKHMPFLTGKNFRLSFPNKGTNNIKVAVGKISVGYYDVNDEHRDSKWVPGDFDCARITNPNPKVTSMQKLNSNPFTFWSSTETKEIEIEFDEKVKIKNVILGLDIEQSGTFYPVPELDNYGRSKPNKVANYMHQNLQLKIDGIKVANTQDSFTPEDNQTHIHFFEYTDNEYGLQDSSVYRKGVAFRDASKGPVDGKKVKLEWETENCRMASLEIIYSKIVSSDLELAQRACLAAHNNYRFRHGLTIEHNYILAPNDALMVSAKRYAAKLIENGKWEHSAESMRGDYGENLFRIRWGDTKPSEFDRLAIAGEAVKQWYSEYVNLDTKSGQRNGNIRHFGQIGHFLQVICRGTESNGKIGIGIESSEDELTTIVCVQYEKQAKYMTRTANYIKYATYIGDESLLTIQEEKALREAIASNTAKDSFKTCQYYLAQSQVKLDYMLDEATAEFAQIVDNGYSSASAWKNKIKEIQNQVSAAQQLKKEDLSTLKLNIDAIRIPQTLAETSFKNLQLTGFLLHTIDILGLSFLVNGRTPDSAIIRNRTLHAIITCRENGWVNQNNYADRKIRFTGPQANGCPEANQEGCRNCIRVMLGVFGVRQNATAHYTKTDEFTNAWKTIIRRLYWVFGNKDVPRAVILEYNRFKGYGQELDKSYINDNGCVKEAHTSQDIKVQFDMITDAPTD